MSEAGGDPMPPSAPGGEPGEAGVETPAATDGERAPAEPVHDGGYAPKPPAQPARAAEKAAPPPPPEAPAGPLRQAAFVLAGFVTIALVDLVMFATRPYAKTPLRVRAVAELCSAGYILAMGVLLAVAVAAWRRFGPRSRPAAYAAITAAAWALGYVFYGEDLSGIADTIAMIIPYHPLRMAILTFGLSISVPLGVLAVRHLAATWHWAIGLAIAVAGIVLNGMEHDYPDMNLFISQSYPGVHLLIVVLSGISAGISLARPKIPARVEAAPPRTWIGIVAAAAVWGALATALRPTNAVLLDLQRYPGAVLFPFIGRLHPPARGAPNVPAGQEAWFKDRSAEPPVPPTDPPIVPRETIVLLLGIDSMRADLLQDEKYRDDLPELFRLRDESVYFTNARSAGTSTAPSLSSMFAGVYYSELYWTGFSLSNLSLVFPHEDKHPRFPELLAKADVDTYTAEGASWLINSYGIVRGFGEEYSARTNRRGGYTIAQTLLAPVVARLKNRDRVKQFYFIHMLDAHSPYTSAGKRATPFLGYVAELSRIDRQIERVMKALAHAKLLGRTIVVIMSDHGEAFGEHGTQRHAVSLYDELLRVPLMIRAPKVSPRVVADPVSLMDIGPTILDTMGVPTPGHYMGQSLTGYLRGESPKLDRPIVAEARLKRSMLLPDGFKVIYDTVTHVVEIYDVANDPREEHNLYREGDPVSAARLGVLTQFFDVHTLKRPGYKVPYRKW